MNIDSIDKRIYFKEFADWMNSDDGCVSSFDNMSLINEIVSSLKVIRVVVHYAAGECVNEEFRFDEKSGQCVLLRENKRYSSHTETTMSPFLTLNRIKYVMHKGRPAMSIDGG